MNEMPEPWKTLSEKVGLTSYRKIADAAGLSVGTVQRAFTGQRSFVAPETLAKLANALRVDPTLVSQALGMGEQPDVLPYQPPQESSLLTLRERKAVDELIRLLVTSRTRTTARLGEAGVGEAIIGHDPTPPPPASDEAYNLARHIATNPDAYDLAAKHHDKDPLDGLGEENQDEEGRW